MTPSQYCLLATCYEYLWHPIPKTEPTIHCVLIYPIYPGIYHISVITELQHTYGPIWVEWSTAPPSFRVWNFNMDKNKSTTLPDLSLELLLMILYHLSPVDIACLALCNRRLLFSLESACVVNWEDPMDIQSWSCQPFVTLPLPPHNNSSPLLKFPSVFF